MRNAVPELSRWPRRTRSHSPSGLDAMRIPEERVPCEGDARGSSSCAKRAGRNVMQLQYNGNPKGIPAREARRGDTRGGPGARRAPGESRLL
eukprot:gene17554-biopygen6397